MPPAGIALPAQHAPPPSYARLSAEDRRHVAAMDAAVARMKKITPAEPYFITVPQDETQKYKHGSNAQLFQWAREQPFDYRTEREWQQYQTFKFSEPGKNLLALHSHDSALPKPAAVEKHRHATGTNTPNQAPRKAISMGDYKKKRAGEPTGGDAGAEKRKEPTAKQPALKGPAENLVSKESAEMLAEINAIEQDDGPAKATKETAPQKAEKANAEKQELKRRREDSAKAQERRTEVNGRTSPPPAKKARTTPPPTTATKATEKAPTPPQSPIPRPVRDTSPAPPADVPDTNLPPKLSPLHEMLDDSFPGRLTPTLPANIIASLEKPKQDTHKPDRNLTPAAAQNGVAKHKSPAPRNGFRATSTSPAVDAVKATETREISKSTTKEDAQETPQSQENHEVPAVEQPHETLIVKFKFRKSIRGDVRRILAFPPRPSKLMSQPAATAETPKLVAKNDDHGDSARRTGKGVAQKVGPSAKKTTEPDRRNFSDKRPRIETEAEEAPQQPPVKNARVDEPQPEVAPATQSKKRPEPSQQPEKSSKKTTKEDPRKIDPKPAEAPTKRKHQDETEEQQPAAKKSKSDKSQPPEPKPAPPPAKAPTTNGSEQQEAPAKKKKPDQARYEPPSRKRSHDASAPQTALKSQPDSLALTKPPNTPTTHNLHSPTISSSNKSLHHTPGGARKNLLSATRHRDTATDSQTSTPSGLGNTPLTNGPTSTSQPPSSQPNGVAKSTAAAKAPLQEAWDAEQKRLEALGRTIKHAASDALNSKDATADKKVLGTYLAVESLLCYLLAYTCADRATAAATDPKQHPTLRAWRSMSGFFAWVQRVTKDEPLLAGLAASLGVVLHAHILELFVAGQQVAASASAILEHNQALLRTAAEADENFDIDVLLKDFPKTWTARTKGALASEEELEPKGLLNGEFKLPLGVASKPVHAVRAGLALLGEFVEGSGLEYELRLKA